VTDAFLHKASIFYVCILIYVLFLLLLLLCNLMTNSLSQRLFYLAASMELYINYIKTPPFTTRSSTTFFYRKVFQPALLMHPLPLPCVCSSSRRPWLSHPNVWWCIQFMKLTFWWLSHTPINICLSAQIFSLASCFWTLSVCVHFLIFSLFWG